MAEKSRATPHPFWAALNSIKIYTEEPQGLLTGKRERARRPQDQDGEIQERQGGGEESRARQEKRKKRKRGEKGKKGKEDREGGEDGLGSSCQGGLVCEQTSPVGTGTYTCAHVCSHKPRYGTDLNPDLAAASAGVTLGWGSLWVGVFEKASGGGGLQGVMEGTGRDGSWIPRAWPEAADGGFLGK